MSACLFSHEPQTHGKLVSVRCDISGVNHLGPWRGDSTIAVSPVGPGTTGAQEMFTDWWMDRAICMQPQSLQMAMMYAVMWHQEQTRRSACASASCWIWVPFLPSLEGKTSPLSGDFCLQTSLFLGSSDKKASKIEGSRHHLIYAAGWNGNAHEHLASQFSSVAQSCPTLCMDCSMPGFPVHHQLPELTQTHVHCIGDSIQPSHPLSSPSPPTFSLPQHQGLFQGLSSSHQVAKVLEFQRGSFSLKNISFFLCLYLYLPVFPPLSFLIFLLYFLFHQCCCCCC